MLFSRRDWHKDIPHHCHRDRAHTVVVRHTHFGECHSDDSIHRRNDCTKLLTQIAAALAIVVALAPCVPLEAARHRTKGSKGHVSAAKIDATIAKFTHDELAAFPRGAVGATIILSEEQFRGNGLRTALDKATSKAQKAISRRPQASRLPEASAHLPDRVPGLAITKSKQHDGSCYFAGTFTTPEGLCFAGRGRLCS